MNDFDDDRDEHDPIDDEYGSDAPHEQAEAGRARHHESSVNTNILDAAQAAQDFIIGTASAEAAALLDAVMAETIGISMHNAVSAQQKSQMISAAAMTATCARLLNAPTPPLTKKTKKNKKKSEKSGVEAEHRAPDAAVIPQLGDSEEHETR